MRLLLVTEKSAAPPDQRDGGARLVSSLRRHLTVALDVLQLDPHEEQGPNEPGLRWRVAYPPGSPDRFERRLQHAGFVAEHLRARCSQGYDKVILVHTSLAFGLPKGGLPGVETLLLPMFLTPSYHASGENVSAAYTAAECRALSRVDRIITPSHLERRQLVVEYGVDPGRVRVVPRGVDLSLLEPRARVLSGPLALCSVGSIKPQKDTLGLVRMFAAIREIWPEATLRIVGPPQDRSYARRVHTEIERLGLREAVELFGYVLPDRLAEVLRNQHLHLSASACETFGRAIFETLASGLPNLARAGLNAAMEHLADEPCARFFENTDQAIMALDELVRDYPQRSASACRVGRRFDDAYLGSLLAAEVQEATIAGITDYDGTLFHKTDAGRTHRCIDAFSRFPLRVICSARPLNDLVEYCAALRVDPHYFVALSGSIVANAEGEVLRVRAFKEAELAVLRTALPLGFDEICHGTEVLQFHVHGPLRKEPPGCRVEQYQGESFLIPRSSSKLAATIWLLRHIDWRGRVRCFGDGPADLNMITFFDGLWLCPTPRKDASVREAIVIPRPPPSCFWKRQSESASWPSRKDGVIDGQSFPNS